MRFLHAIHGTGLSTTDEHLSEERASFLVVKSVNRKNLLAVHIRQTEYRLDGIKTLPELALVKQHHHVGVVDDGFFHDFAADNVLYLLSHHTNTGPEFTGGLVQILDVLCHHGRCDGFPRLLDDEHLAVFLDAHLLQKHIHDDKCDKREE